MTDRPNGFDRRFTVPGRALSFDHAAGLDRRVAEVARIAEIKADACPPMAMQAAPIAPARGPQVLVADYAVTNGGMRQRVGAHWQGLSPLAAMVASARLRHAARGVEAAFVPAFSPGQIAVAEDYAALVEWRDGSAIKCASLEAGRGGGGAGLFIDTFVQQGRWLAELQHRIGDGVALDLRRHMDRGNSRLRLTVRAAVDMVCLGGQDVSAVLVRFGWQADGKHRNALRTAIAGALDRMQGYKDG